MKYNSCKHYKGNKLAPEKYFLLLILLIVSESETIPSFLVFYLETRTH